MPRAKRGFKSRRYHKKVLKAAKGYHGARSTLIRTAMEAVDHALQYAYVGRKLKKRDYRGLWQTRIAAAAKMSGTSYSRLIGDLKKKGSELDRKVLADLAANHPADFAAIVEWAKAA
jgi:large subunit ribosomal protein L20